MARGPASMVRETVCITFSPLVKGYLVCGMHGPTDPNCEEDMTQDVWKADLEEALEDLWQLIVTGEPSQEDLEPLLEEARELVQKLAGDEDAQTMLAELENELVSILPTHAKTTLTSTA